MKNYWIVQFLFDYVLYLAVLAIVLITGVAAGFTFFTENPAGQFIILFLFWGVATS